MIGGLDITRSGLLHSQRRLNATAHNAANLVTEKTALLRVTGLERPPGQGVMSRVTATAVDRFRGGALPSGVLDPRTGSFLTQAVEQVTIRHQSGALLRVAQTQDDMLGMLVDLSA